MLYGLPEVIEDLLLVIISGTLPIAEQMVHVLPPLVGLGDGDELGPVAVLGLLFAHHCHLSDQLSPSKV